MNEPFNEKTIHSLLCNQDVKSLLSNYLKQGVKLLKIKVVEEMTRVDATRKDETPQESLPLDERPDAALFNQLKQRSINYLRNSVHLRKKRRKVIKI